MVVCDMCRNGSNVNVTLMAEPFSGGKLPWTCAGKLPKMPRGQRPAALGRECLQRNCRAMFQRFHSLY